MELGMTDIQKLDEFLVKIARTRMGVRRKIVIIERFLNKLQENSEPQYLMED